MFSQRTIKNKVGATINPTVIGTPMKYATRNPRIISPSVIGFVDEFGTLCNGRLCSGRLCNCRCPMEIALLCASALVVVKTLGFKEKRVSKEFIIN
ncbi:MAG: hypothetical protein Terrestrivirus4_135 [Terrestrivirus sp.]|uniref:Uncharacterized protein n=1 Tax=Terrestrivirus sp. TaxID=2487775 RepID=A0A3G4ZML5_9VIRU|nr:MAG: hypothetical protein Terrestrivirus4_135 [Terrestrivirus sp.]